MDPFLYFLLQASVVMMLFYAFYKLFFGKNTFHHINRFLLLLIAVMATVLPFFRFKLIPEIIKKTVVENLPMDFSTIPVVEMSGLYGSRAAIHKDSYNVAIGVNAS